MWYHLCVFWQGRNQEQSQWYPVVVIILPLEILRTRWLFSADIIVCGSVDWLWFLSRLFSTNSPTSCHKHVCMCICLPLSSEHRPHFAKAFILPVSVQKVPGYRQVSSERKDLFCCFGSPVSVGSLGKGWGGSTAHLCLGLVWPLSCGRASLHCSTLLWDSFYAVWYDICPLPLKKKNFPFALASFSWHWASIVITNGQLLRT